ncbi:ionotropic receptor 93a-like [Tetranychus urticae]|nr:ionotropic receptor 93a-like [Tetranychus urticae]
MLIDMRHDFLRKWDHINLIHDDTIDVMALHDLVDGLSAVHGPEIMPSTVTSYHIGLSLKNKIEITSDYRDINDSQVTLFSYENVKTDTLDLKAQVVDHITDEHKYFIVIAHSKHIKEIIKLAHSRSLLGSPRKWIFIFSDNQEDPAYWSQLSPILATTQTAIVIREESEYGRCSEMSEGCQFRLAVETLKSTLRKVALTADYDFTDVDMKRRTRNRLLTEMRLQLGSDESVSSRYCGNCDRYSLQMFEKAIIGESIKYKRKPYSTSHWSQTQFDDDFESGIKITRTGEWTPFKGLIQSSDPIPVDIVNGGGQVYKVGVVNQRPLVNVELIDGKCVVNGTTIELLTIISSRMNFTIEYVCWSDAKDDKIGDSISDEGWDGLLGKLAEGKVDLAANGIWQTPSRIKSSAFEFLSAYDVDIVSLVVKKQPEDEKFLFICPFTLGTWICVILTMIVIGPVLWTVHRSSIYYDYYGLNDGKGFFKLSNCVWYCYGAMVQQGGDILPQAISGRVLIATWWLFVIVTVTTYSGNLVALLTFPKIIQPIQNAEDLANTWGVSAGAAASGALHEMIQILEYSELSLLRDKMSYYDFEKDKYKIFDEISSGSLGYLMTEYEARYWVSTEYTRTGVCGMHVARDAVYHTPIHMVARKDAFPPSLLKELNRQMTLLTRAGIAIYWRLWYQTPGNDCMYPLIIHAGDVKKIDVVHMIGIYLFLACGIGIGFLILISEFITKYYISSDDDGLKMKTAKRQFSGSSGIQDVLKSIYTRYNANPSYSKWASNVDYYNSAEGRSTGESKLVKLSFNHPTINRDTKESFARSKWIQGASAVRAKASPNLYYDQFGPMYLNQIRGIYNDPDNFQYPFGGLRPK